MCTKLLNEQIMVLIVEKIKMWKLLLPIRTLLTLCKVNKYYAFGVKKTK